VRAELFHTEPDRPEGELSKLRRAVVNTYALAGASQRAGLGAVMRLGRGEDQSGGREKPSLLCNALEAVVGAAFLDGGWDAASAMVLRLVGEELSAARAAGPDAGDPKTLLQEVAARERCDPPEYAVVDDGPEHEKTFAATVVVARPDGSAPLVGTGGGPSKKAAEQSAARDALRRLEDGEASTVGREVLSAATPGMGARDA
jgi:ribonuclease-3